jgi:hypothetical protein
MEWLRGKKTYIMIAVDAADQLGITLGWWPESRLREIFEFILTGTAVRLGIKSSGLVK